MQDRDLDAITAWIVGRGLAGDTEIALLEGFANRCVDAGLEISRGTMIIDTLHPVYEGRAFFWRRDGQLETTVAEYGPTTQPITPVEWKRSPFYWLLESGKDELHLKLCDGETGGFPIVDELRTDGQTDYVALIQRFGREAAIGEMDCFLSRWTTEQPGGFREEDIAALRRLVPVLGLAVKSRSLARVAESLVETYLGRDPGRRVLQGKMSRGVVEKIHAVLWFSDMQGFTSLSESMESDQLIPLLDDYADAVISSVHAAGGDVLKLIGDGVLAIFNAEAPEAACIAALAAEADLRARLAALQAERQAEKEPVADIYLGLHIGDVFYGNIGSKERLDFTVIGQAVNEVSRIASLCQSAGRDVLFSAAFQETLPPEKQSELVSVGRYALRGVGRAQELFTLDPELAASRSAIVAEPAA